MADADIPLPDEGPDGGVPSQAESRDVSDALSDDEGEVQQSNMGSDDEGEDLLDNAAADYRPMEHLDAYEADGIDAAFVDGTRMEDQMGARMAAERELRKRDRREGRLSGARRLPGALAEDEDEDDRPTRRQRLDPDYDEDDEDDEAEAGFRLEDQRGAAGEWVAKEPVQRKIAARFRRFLLTFSDKEDGQKLYYDAIRDMCAANKQSLYVSYAHISQAMPILAVWVADVPNQMFQIFNRVAYEVCQEIFEDIHQVVSEVYVRIKDLPISDSIRDLRQYHLNALVRLTGVVTRRSGVFPQLQQVKYDCQKCGYSLGPFHQNTEKELHIAKCPACQSAGPFLMNVSETIYRNYQKLTLQESPGSVQAGRLPRHREVILLHDLIDCARPGEEIQVTGVYMNTFDATLNVKQGFPVFSTHVEANHVQKTEDVYAAYKLTDEDNQKIHQMAADKRIGQKICKSIAPSIYGHANIKTGIALAMFGGQEKSSGATHRLRGDINMLLLGDPGTAKSQFLKYIEKAAQRAVYTTGKGASAVGLTASVHKDPVTREWTLEGGALVLADRGVCLIDEFDKMNDQDRVSIHEAMEQQSISISKAGIVTQLQARCSVIAAANPIGGRYDSSRTFAENVELSDPILSRFDILCVVKDVVDPVADEKLARFVVGSHRRSHPDRTEEAAEEARAEAESSSDIISQEMLRKYVTYAKQTCRPKLQNADYQKIAAVYTDLRKESAISHGMPIAVRHLESMIRMSEAHAAMHLREYVNDQDIDMAIKVMLDSFVSTQKQSVQKAMQKKFRKFITSKTEFHELALTTLRELLRQQLNVEAMIASDGEDPGPDVFVQASLLEDQMREYNVPDISSFYSSPQFLEANFRFLPAAPPQQPHPVIAHAR
mmetsp:Transcript_15174/g.45748  ORF Transcript_15174/g.45748 Transcript_15174/m.45748 type:complete len:886 (-) Transcript_15174:420-3077(-)